jgi:hypothetical protein
MEIEFQMNRSSKKGEVRNSYISLPFYLTPRAIEALILLFSDYIRPVEEA